MRRCFLQVIYIYLHPNILCACPTCRDFFFSSVFRSPFPSLFLFLPLVCRFSALCLINSGCRLLLHIAPFHYFNNGVFVNNYVIFVSQQNQIITQCFCALYLCIRMFNQYFMLFILHVSFYFAQFYHSVQNCLPIYSM